MSSNKIICFQHLGLKRKHLKNSICISLIYLTLYSSAYATKPEYVFNAEIYEQEEKINALKKFRPNITDPKFNKELNKELMDELNRRKLEQLNEKCLKRMNQRRLDLMAEFKVADDAKFWGEMIKGVGSLFLPIGTIPGLALEKFMTSGVSTFLGKAIEAFSLSFANICCELVNHKREFLKKTPPDTIMREIRDLDKEIREAIDVLSHEPIADLERRYIEQKRYIGNEELEKEIERGLIQARVADYFFQVNIPAIGYALGLPLRAKPLLDNKDLESLNKSELELIAKFRKDKEFSIYKKEVREKILNIILEVAKNSVAPDKNGSPLRVIEHFFGPGSSGKSTLAKGIARFLNLPYFEKRITNPDVEIKEENIFGATRSFQGAPVLGWLAEALLQKGDVDKESYENAFLILDDFPVNNQNAQNILLNITDPQKENFFNNYLQFPLKTSKLNTLIISNDDFKSLKPIELKPTTSKKIRLKSLTSKPITLKSPIEEINQKTTDSPFEALRTRFDSTYIPAYDLEQIRILVTPYLEKTLVTENKPPSFHKIEYLDPTAIKITYDSQTLADLGLKENEAEIILFSTGLDWEQSKSITSRQLKRVLKNTMIRYGRQILEKRECHFNEYKKWLGAPNMKEKARHYLKLAALNGHPMALDIQKKIANGETTYEILILEQKVEDKVGDREQQKRNAEEIITFYTDKKNTRKRNEWWGKAYQLVEKEVSPLILEHLKSKITGVNALDTEDYQLLALTEPSNQGIAITNREKIDITSREAMTKPFEFASEYEKKYELTRGRKDTLVYAERWYEFAERNGHKEAIFSLARLSHRRDGKEPEDQRRYNAVVQTTDFKKVNDLNHIVVFKEICKKQGKLHQQEQWNRRLLTRMFEEPFSFKVLKKDQTNYSDKGSPLQNLFAPSQFDISNLVGDLKHTWALTSFTIYYRDLGDEEIKPLCRALKTNNSLTSINLSFSYITNNGIAMLGEALEGKTQLRDLTMEDICPRFDEQSIINLSKKLSNVRLNTPHGEYNLKKRV